MLKKYFSQFRISERQIIILLFVPLFILSLILLWLNTSAGMALSQYGNTSQYIGLDEHRPVSYDYEYCKNLEQPKYDDTESIYVYRECDNCHCWNAGKQAIRLNGLDANCERKETEAERFNCYSALSQANYDCLQYDSPEAINTCYAKYPGYESEPYNYYTGGAGTITNNYNLVVDGQRTYFIGFDRENEHQIMTGNAEPGNVAITLRDSSRDVEFGHKLTVEAGKLNLLSTHGGMYFDVQSKFDRKTYFSPYEVDICQLQEEYGFIYTEYSGMGEPVADGASWVGCLDGDERTGNYANDCFGNPIPRPGANLFKQGNTAGAYDPGEVELIKPDLSLMDNMVREYFCVGDEMRFAELPCPPHTISYEGVCVHAEKSYIKGQGVVENDLGSGLDTSSYLTDDQENDLLINANYQNVLALPEDRRSDQRLQVKKGLEVQGDVKVDSMVFQGDPLIWTPPVEDNLILYYQSAKSADLITHDQPREPLFINPLEEEE